MKPVLFAALSVLAVGASAQAADFHCTGTEPFWSIRATETTLRYSSPDVLSGQKLKIVSRREAAGTAPGFATVIKTKYTSLTLVRGEECTDGMSDATYTHHAVYEIGGGVLYGCCRIPE